MRLGCSGCLALVVGIGLGALLAGGTLGVTVRMLAVPDVEVTTGTARDGSVAQGKLFGLTRQGRRGETVALSEAELNALLAHHLVAGRGLELSSLQVRLLGADRLELYAQVPLRQILEEISPVHVADLLPGRWQQRPVWLRLGGAVRVEPGTRRHVRVNVEDFAVGRQRLPVPILRVLLDPGVVGLLRWSLPERVESVGVEPGRLIIRTVS